jgi:hypothetical protein
LTNRIILLEALRAVRTLRPRAVLFENVAIQIICSNIHHNSIALLSLKVMSRSHDDTTSTSRDSWYRSQAKKRFHDEGFLEIDETAPVSQAEGNPDKGAYVQAWIWIYDAEIDKLQGQDVLDKDED